MINFSKPFSVIGLEIVFFQLLGPWPLILLGVSPAESEKGNCIRGDRMQIMGINEATKWDSCPNLQPGLSHNDRSFNSSRLLRILSILKSDRLAKPPFMPAFAIVLPDSSFATCIPKDISNEQKSSRFHRGSNRLLFRNALKALKERFPLKSQEEILFGEKVATPVLCPENRWRA